MAGRTKSGQEKNKRQKISTTVRRRLFLKDVLRRRIIKKVKALDLTREKKKEKFRTRWYGSLWSNIATDRPPSVQIFRDNDHDRVVVDRGRMLGMSIIRSTCTIISPCGFNYLRRALT